VTDPWLTLIVALQHFHTIFSPETKHLILLSPNFTRMIILCVYIDVVKKVPVCCVSRSWSYEVLEMKNDLSEGIDPRD